ncbi:MAG TPA: hypothetical protein VL096_01025 [Pirellulaceae bacterium]|nr:hypothetical protein [Pirellulaceae bacterium]
MPPTAAEIAVTRPVKNGFASERNSVESRENVAIRRYGTLFALAIAYSGRVGQERLMGEFFRDPVFNETFDDRDTKNPS